jgi:YD repeat-containing protein
MLTYQFLTKRIKQKMRWRIPKRTIGKRVEYIYDAKGDLVAVKDTSDVTVQFTYLTDPKAPEHYLDKVIDPLGRSAAKTEFDEQGRIKKVIDADGKVIEYEFDTGSKIQKVKDQLGNVTIIENDDRGNVIREVSPEGAITLRTYDSNNNMLTETQVVIHNGVEIKLTTTYTYDADNNKLTETDARGNVTRYTYNKYDQITSVTSGGVTTYTMYDEQTGWVRSATDENGNTTYYSYDDRGNLTSLINSNGVQLVENTYNQYGEVTSIRSITGRTTYMDYDSNGDCIATWFIENGQRVLDTTTYDAVRRIVGTARYILPTGLLPLGKTINDYKLWETQTIYNVAGQIIKQLDQNGFVTEITYDPRGLETQIRTQKKDQNGNVIWSIQRTVYNATGEIIYATEWFNEGTPVTDILGSQTIYDKDGRSTGSKELLGLNIKIDELGRSSVISEGLILDSSVVTYNNAGWLLSGIDKIGLETRYIYNTFGEVTQIRQQLSDGTWIVSETVYDSQGRIVFSTDLHLEGVTDVYGYKSLYDSQGRILGSEQYKGSKIIIAEDGSSSAQYYGTKISDTLTIYDSKGRVHSITDEEGNTTQFEYDNLDREIKTISNGLVTETICNSHDRVTEMRTINGSEIRTTKYEYDLFGNIVKTIFSDNTIITATYNDKGQKISETNQLGQTRTFSYDDNGQLVKVILPGGAVYTYEYDIDGNPILIRDPNGHETRFTYDSNGNMLTRTLPLGFGADGIKGTIDDICTFQIFSLKKPLVFKVFLNKIYLIIFLYTSKMIIIWSKLKK